MKPKYHVFVCAQNRPPGHPRGSCAQKGATDVLQGFWAEQKKRNAFDDIAITYSGCIGLCDSGANVLVYPDGTLYGSVTPADIEEIFDKHFGAGEVVERLKVSESIW